MQDREKHKPYHDQTQDAGHHIINQHRNLKIQRFFPVRVDFRGVAAFDQPDDERPENVARSRNHEASQRAQMTHHAPRPDISRRRSFAHIFFIPSPARYARRARSTFHPDVRSHDRCDTRGSPPFSLPPSIPPTPAPPTRADRSPSPARQTIVRLPGSPRSRLRAAYARPSVSARPRACSAAEKYFP